MPRLIVRVAGGRGADGGRAHQRFFASSWALKIPSGIALATGSPLSCCGVSGASPAAGGSGQPGVLLPAAIEYWEGGRENEDEDDVKWVEEEIAPFSRRQFPGLALASPSRRSPAQREPVRPGA